MTTRSTAKKVLQNFHARMTLWKIFEVKAEEMECTIDYLINEAMRLYASTHGFLDADESEEPSQVGEPGHVTDASPTGGYTTNPGRGPGILPRPGITRPTRASSPPPLPRPTAAVPTGPVPTGTIPTGPAPTGQIPTTPRPPMPPAPSQDFSGLPTTGAHPNLPSLTLIYQGRKIPVTNTQFIIGRGAKSSDLAIKDANVSRKHAAIIFHNGAFYLKDLGSTNGVEYKGKQVDSKRIDEGDVFSICGHELHFTYAV
jgi:hypothetical protein